MVGAIAIIGTQVMVHVTGTDEFCGAACHSMQWVAKEHRESIHGATRTGMRATCHDCHIPREYPELLWYKAVAGTKDVIGEMRGIISTEEKFRAERKRMAGAGVGRIQGQRFARVPRLPRVLHRGAREAAGNGASRPRAGARGPGDLHRLPQRGRARGALIILRASRLGRTPSVDRRDLELEPREVVVNGERNLGLLKSIELSMQQAEHEADAVGLQLAALAGYVPAEQLRFMENEARQTSPRAPVVATQPTARSRLLQLQATLPLAQRLYGHGLERRTPDF